MVELWASKLALSVETKMMLKTSACEAKLALAARQGGFLTYT